MPARRAGGPTSLTARGQQWYGKGAIADFLADRQANTARKPVHLVTNERAHRVNDREVELEATLVLLIPNPDGGYRIEAVLDTTQTLRAGPAGWRIAQRTTKPVHRAA